MATPNPEIWGAPETWINSKIWVGANNDGNSNIKACRAKTANFGGDDNAWAGALGRGIAQGRISLEPIDNSFVLCGQNPAKSAYGAIKIFTNKQDDTLNKIPDKTITYNKPINFMFHSLNANDNGYIGSLYTGIWGGIVNLQNPKMRIAPDAEEGSGGARDYNFNLQSSPYIYYQIRSLWAVIWVHEDNNTYEGGSWWTLEDWKNNHSSSSICEISVDLFGYSYDDGATIHLSRAPNNLGDFRAITATTLEPIDGVTMYANTAYNQAPIIMLLNKLIYNYHETAYTFIGYGWRSDFNGGTIKSYTDPNSTSHGWSLQLSIPYTADNYERIMSEMACFGIPFSDSNHDSYPIDFNANYVCLPVINDEGIATGEYTRGADNLTNPFAALDSVRDKNYDPNKDYDPNTYSNQTYFNPVLNLSSMCKRYVLNDAAVEQLCRDLWKISDDLIHTDPNEDFKDYDQLVLDNFLVNSPIDVIVSLDKYPITDIPTGTTAEAIKYGKATGAALGKPLSVNTIFFNFEGVKIYPKFGRSFLDYSPYTTYEIYIPFCGIVPLEAGDIMDHILSVQMVMDLSTGAVTAYIMVDNLCIETATGSASLNIPVSGIDSITLNSQINNALLTAKSAQMQARTTGTSLGRIGSGSAWKWLTNPVGVVEKEVSDKWSANQADYDLNHQQFTPHKIGSASSACSWSLELTCRLMIYYPEGEAIDSSGGVSPTSPHLADLTMYGHTTGFACIYNGLVSGLHGYTVGNIDTSGIAGATDTEREMIKSLFASGVYLP